MPNTRKGSKSKKAQRPPARARKTPGTLVTTKIMKWLGTGSASLFATSVSAGAGCLVTPYVDLGTSALQGLHYMGLAYAFQLGDLPSYANYTAIYDQYRIDRVDVVMLLMANNARTSDGAHTNGTAYGVVHSAVDYDDYVAPLASEVGANAMRARVGYRCDPLFGSSPLTWSVQPRLAAPAYTGSVFSAHTSPGPTWLDSSSVIAQHYGIKWLFEVANPLAAFAVMTVKVQFRYHISLRIGQ